jgi:hypothetical protein
MYLYSKNIILLQNALPVYYGFEGHNGPVKAIMDRSLYGLLKKE